MSRLERNDCELHYEVCGAGSPVLWTHGFAGTSQIWRGQADAFAERHQSITWDLRGHGRSTSPEEPAAYRVDESVADMAALLDRLGHDRAILGGHSLGGYLSLAFALKYPERVRALLIIDTGPGYKSEAPRNEWNEMAKGLGRRLQRDGLEVLAKLNSEMDPSQHASADGLAKAACVMLTQHDSRIIDALPAIQAPTLVIVGAKDRAYLAACDYMAQKIPGAEKAVITDAGHAVNLHQPERFNRAVGEFLERVERTARIAKDPE